MRTHRAAMSYGCCLHVVSHIVDIEDTTVMGELATVMSRCGLAFGCTAQAVKDLFGFGACDDQADLYDGDFIIPDEG